MKVKMMSEKASEMDLAKAAEWLNVDPSDLANYTLALFFLNLHKQGTCAMKPEEKAKFEAVVKELEPKIEPALERVKGEKLEEVTATFHLPKRLIQLIQGENYFGYSKEEFYADSVKCLLSCIISEKSVDEVEAFKKKYGLKPDDTAT